MRMGRCEWCVPANPSEPSNMMFEAIHVLERKVLEGMSSQNDISPRIIDYPNSQAAQ